MIKFRAWDGREFTDPSIYLFVNPDGTLKARNHSGLTIERFTGFKDSNGREIFEGDRVDSRLKKDCVVYWDARSGSFRFGSGWVFNFKGAEVTVIGNIHENL